MAPEVPRSSERQAVIRVFVLAFLIYAYFMPRWADWNIDSRFDLVRALVDRHTLLIDAYHWNTWDKAVYNGHYYSDKAPGTAFLGAAVYAAFAGARALPISGGAIQMLERNGAWNAAIALGKTDTQQAPAARGRVLGGCQRSGVRGNVQYIPWGNRLVPPFTDWALSKYVVTIGAVAFPCALFIAFFFWFLGFFSQRRWIRWLVTSVLGMGTVMLPYSTVLYSHALVAGFLFTGFALFCLISMGRIGGWGAPVAGFLLGASLFTEYTVALVVTFVGAFGVWILRRRPRLLAATAAAGAIPLLGLFAYNFAAFGSGLDTGYTHDFCWSSAQAAGFAGFTAPKSGPLFDLTFGAYRGLFFTSPFLLFALPGLIVMMRRRYRLEAAVCALSAIALVLAISAYWGWNGGQVDGPRYLVPAVPFLAFPALFWLEAAVRVPALLAVSLAAAAWSLFATWALFLGGLLFPSSWLRNPLADYSLPNLGKNQVAPNAGFFLGLDGWPSLIPLAILLLVLAAIWASPTALAIRRRSRLVTQSAP